MTQGAVSVDLWPRPLPQRQCELVPIVHSRLRDETQTRADDAKVDEIPHVAICTVTAARRMTKRG
eukprot:6179945-Pleurochrysis_carterae.AAC.1